jgi:hypothetical protein
MSAVHFNYYDGLDVSLRIAGPGSRGYALIVDWHIHVVPARARLAALSGSR